MQKCSGAPTPITSVRSGDPEADGQLLEAEDHRIFRRVVGIARFLNTSTRHRLCCERIESSFGGSSCPRF